LGLGTKRMSGAKGASSPGFAVGAAGAGADGAEGAGLEGAEADGGGADGDIGASSDLGGKTAGITPGFGSGSG